MDILKRIDFVQQFANECGDGAWSIDTAQWKHHVTPELIEDIRQYIVSLQLKLMHEQTARVQENERCLAMMDAIGCDWRDAGDMAKFYATNYLREAIRALLGKEQS